MLCPVCGNTTCEDSKLIIPESIDGPAEYLEFSICIVCQWSDLPAAEEEIPF